MEQVDVRTREAYDRVATRYAEHVRGVPGSLPLERAMLGVFAELVSGGGGLPVADVGCGPGQLTGYLGSLGLSVFGVDLSSEMVALAGRAYPDLRFVEGSMTELAVADGVLGGVLSSYSTIHTPPERLPLVFAEFGRVLVSGGHLLLGFFGASEFEPRVFDHRVAPAYRWSPDALLVLLRSAGFAEVGRLQREPYSGERFPQSQLLVYKL